MKRLSKEQVLMMHSDLIEQTGGTNGVRDYNLLESALETPFQSFAGNELYPTDDYPHPSCLIFGYTVNDKVLYVVAGDCGARLVTFHTLATSLKC